jgi:hypothetical protein
MVGYGRLPDAGCGHEMRQLAYRAFRLGVENGGDHGMDTEIESFVERVFERWWRKQK